MAITYRGQASRLNKIESKQNASGFQEKSDPGPRQGVGGGSVSLNQAKASFEKRFSSPTKKKNFYGGEAYFQDGYGGDLASPAKINPITQKSKSSPFKINEALVAGASLTGKKFVDAGAEVGKLFEEKEEPKAADLSVNTKVKDTPVISEDEPIVED
tara:strand:- start:264 stop:734 length:471 start_codon:yes stop_codon:yes gene_type:complete